MQKINVYPNPFIALGTDGLPCGRVLVEPGHPRPFDVVGGKLERRLVPHEEDASRSPKERALAKKLDVRDTRLRVVAHVKMRPIIVPAAPFRSTVACGDLVAADPASARACGIDTFRAPLEVLREAKTAAEKDWAAINGEPPALASFDLVQNGDEIALAEKELPVREAPPNGQATPKKPA